MITERITVVLIAFFLDLLFGDPHWLWHPVRAIGTWIQITEKILRKIFHIALKREADRRKKQLAGVLLVLLVLPVSVGIPILILYITGKIHFLLGLLVESIMCYQMLAMRSLKTESMKVYDALKNQDIEAARTAVSMIVGRDTENLNEEGITKAAVETVAENTSDGVIAPLIFMFLFGAPGAFFYKAVNTMDSMVGYKNNAYRYFGTAAAKLDDILNFLPSRISAVFMIAASFFLGYDAKNAVNIYRRDRLRHASPNSAQTEAVCAGALGIQLAGNAYYFGELHQKPTIGDSLRKIEPEDIKRANRLLYGTSFFIFLSGMILLFFIQCLNK